MMEPAEGGAQNPLHGEGADDDEEEEEEEEEAVEVERGMEEVQVSATGAGGAAGQGEEAEEERSPEEVIEDELEQLRRARELRAKLEEEARLLDVRREAELELVQKFDRDGINPRRECWFLVDNKWLREWSAFVHGESDLSVEDAEDPRFMGPPPPGPVRNAELFDENGKVLEELEARVDYRGVVPVVWFMFVELYGKDPTPPICRYSVDIYAPDVPGKYKRESAEGPSKQARVEVHRVRQLWVDWGIPEDEDSEDLCCGITREHIEAFLFWFFTCCWGKSDRPKYRAYQPLRGQGDDHDEEDEDEDEDDDDAEDGESGHEERKQNGRSRGRGSARGRGGYAAFGDDAFGDDDDDDDDDTNFGNASSTQGGSRSSRNGVRNGSRNGTTHSQGHRQVEMATTTTSRRKKLGKDQNARVRGAPSRGYGRRR